MRVRGYIEWTQPKLAIYFMISDIDIYNLDNQLSIFSQQDEINIPVSQIARWEQQKPELVTLQKSGKYS